MKDIVIDRKSLPRLKLSFLDEKFFVNREKKTVTCKMLVAFKSPNLSTDYLLNTPKGYFGAPFEVVATVRLHEGDVWDETKGHQLAQAKAKRAAYLKASEILRTEVVEPIMRGAMTFANAMDEWREWADDELDSMERLSPGIISNFFMRK